MRKAQAMGSRPSSGRRRGHALSIAAAVAAVVAAESCVFDTATTLCESGRRCRSGQECAAAQDACIPIGGCGDLIVDRERGEVCDDGNIRDGDGCSRDCTSDETCGNGLVDDSEEVGETCDDGNTSPGDGCSEMCRREECGNGVLDAGNGEACDDGNAVGGDGCSASCESTERCGNGFLDVLAVAVPEECDDGVLPPVDTAGCNRDCTLARCGDGHHNSHVVIDEATGQTEQCDTGGDTPACDFDCTFVICGDDYVNAAAGEDCDTGPDRRNTADCNGQTCTRAECGDGIYNPEHINPQTQLPEACDTAGDTQACDANCTAAFCGDGDTNPKHIDPATMLSELCDDGDTSNRDGCLTTCQPARCGDGFVHDEEGGTEQCDDGDGDNNDGCPDGPMGTCEPARCGDGFVHDEEGGTEQCDTGGVNKDNCDSDCTLPACGDGIWNEAAGEVCDSDQDCPEAGQNCVANCTECV